MKGDNRSAIRATFQMDQLEAKLRDVLKRTSTNELSNQILRLVEADSDYMAGMNPEFADDLWTIISTTALLAMGREITRRAADAKS